MPWLFRGLLVPLLIFFVVACEPVSEDFPQRSSVKVTPGVVKLRLKLVREIKAFEARLGWKPTDNFGQYSRTRGVYPYCTYAGEFDFILSNSTTEKKKCEEEGAGRDTVYSEIEAIAGSNTPLSRSLVADGLPRFIYLIFHEDFHEQILGVPTLEINESAAQLISLLAGRDFAREKYGEGSKVYRLLAADVELSLASARIENRYHKELSNLYDRVLRGELGREEGLEKKALLFKEMRGECKKGVKLATSFSCEDMTNNAVFATNIPYAMYYPLFYDLYQSCALDVKKTGLSIVQLVGEDLDEGEFVRRTEELIKKGCTFPGAS